MRKPVFITGEEAAAMIADNATVATIGMTLVSAAETILKAIEQRFLETGSPRGLTPVSYTHLDVYKRQVISGLQRNIHHSSCAQPQDALKLQAAPGTIV